MLPIAPLGAIEKLIVFRIGWQNNRLALECRPMEMSEKYEDLESLKKLAEKFGMSPTSLRVYINQKKIHAIKKGRDWMTTEEEIRKYLKNRLRKR